MGVLLQKFRIGKIIVGDDVDRDVFFEHQLKRAEDIFEVGDVQAVFFLRQRVAVECVLAEMQRGVGNQFCVQQGRFAVGGVFPDFLHGLPVAAGDNGRGGAVGQHTVGKGLCMCLRKAEDQVPHLSVSAVISGPTVQKQVLPGRAQGIGPGT